MTQSGLSQDDHEAALHVLGENALVKAMMQIVTINAWNRMAIATAMKPLFTVPSRMPASDPQRSSLKSLKE